MWALVVENRSNSFLLERIVNEAGGFLYSDTLAPAGQPGDSYTGMFRYNAPALATAMLKNRPEF